MDLDASEESHSVDEDQEASVAPPPAATRRGKGPSVLARLQEKSQGLAIPHIAALGSITNAATLFSHIKEQAKLPAGIVRLTGSQAQSLLSALLELQQNHDIDVYLLITPCQYIGANKDFAFSYFTLILRSIKQGESVSKFIENILASAKRTIIEENKCQILDVVSQKALSSNVYSHQFFCML